MMIDVFSIRDAGDALAFVGWMLAVLGAVRIVFYSFPAAEFQWWYAQRNAASERSAHRLQWEIKHKREWDTAIVAKDPKGAECRELAESEVQARTGLLRSIARGTVGQRALRYFADCVGCQSFWIAGAALLLTRGWIGFAPLVATACAYSFACQLAHAWLIRSAPGGAPVGKGGGCASGKCGGK